MPTCVTEGSYNILFIVGICISLGFLVSSAYFYNQFSKASNDQLTHRSSEIGKNISIFALVGASLALALLFIMYFAFSQRMVGVYTQAPLGHR
jgi:heme/copper-type cytochrome/quinol oxidase subunit 2